MRTEDEIREWVRECEIAIRLLRQKNDEVSRQKEINALIERNAYLRVLGNGK